MLKFPFPTFWAKPMDYRTFRKEIKESQYAFTVDAIPGYISRDTQNGSANPCWTEKQLFLKHFLEVGPNTWCDLDDYILYLNRIAPGSAEILGL